MPIVSNANTNPLTTYPALGPATRGPQGGDSNSYVFPGVAASGVVALPKVESYPATFFVNTTGGANNCAGIVTVHAAASVSVLEIVNFSGTGAAQKLVPTAPGGVLTLTANGTFTTRDVIVTRIA